MNKEIVLSIIKKNQKHLTAYEILEKFKKIKPVQPMTVYRALDALIKDGFIHKSNQTKTFILCNHDHREEHNPALAICKNCGETDELDANIFKKIFKTNKLKKFNLSQFEIEVSTLCRACATQ